MWFSAARRRLGGGGPLSRGPEDVKSAKWFGPFFDWVACYNKQLEPPAMLVPALAGDGDTTKYAGAELGEGGTLHDEDEAAAMSPELTRAEQQLFERFDDF